MAGYGFETGLDIVKTNDTDNPDAQHVRLKAKPSGEVYAVDSDGTERKMTNDAPVTTTQLNIDGGASSTVFGNYLLRLDFGSGGATINPTGTP